MALVEDVEYTACREEGNGVLTLLPDVWALNWDMIHFLTKEDELL